MNLWESRKQTAAGRSTHVFQVNASADKFLAAERDIFASTVSEDSCPPVVYYLWSLNRCDGEVLPGQSLNPYSDEICWTRSH